MADPPGAPENAARIAELADLLRKQDASRPAPVESWNPPPCGDIGLRIVSDGTWVYGGTPIARKALVQLFARVLRRDPDGRYFLVTPVERVPITVEDAPFLAVEMQVDGEGPGQLITFRTAVDDIVRCGPEHPLRLVRQPGTGGLKPYVRVRGGLEALLTRALTFDLVGRAVGGPAGCGIGVWSGGSFFPLGDPQDDASLQAP